MPDWPPRCWSEARRTLCPAAANVSCFGACARPRKYVLVQGDKHEVLPGLSDARAAPRPSAALCKAPQHPEHACVQAEANMHTQRAFARQLGDTVLTRAPSTFHVCA
jgi:hypothetical protein